MCTVIQLPYRGPGAQFEVQAPIDHILRNGRDYMLQGHCLLQVGSASKRVKNPERYVCMHLSGYTPRE